MIEEVFLNQNLGPLGLTNFLRHAIHWGVSQGYSLDLLLLIFLLPLALTAVALARYLIGIQGLNFFAPIIMAVAFLPIGIIPGLILFLVILLIEILVILILRRLKIHFVAKMALVLLFVSLVFLLLLFLISSFNLSSLFNSSLISILVLILIGENLAEVQLRKAPKKAFRAVLETLILAFLAFAVLNSITLRKMMLIFPEMMIVLIAILDIWIGHFTGLRLLEYRRFHKLLKK
jgi:hypothetical protein